MSQPITKSLISKAIISKIEKESKPKKILAHYIEEYNSPNKVTLNGKVEGYVPDIAAIYENETLVYEIELTKQLQVYKLRTLSLYAMKNGGNFFIVVPDYLKNYAEYKIRQNKINAGIIYFETQRQKG